MTTETQTHTQIQTQCDRAGLLHDLHHGDTPLVLANVWDAASVRLVAAAGARAIATASASVSWTLGARDGGGLDRDRALAQTALIVRAAGDLPVTADLEDGFAGTDAGVAGISLGPGLAEVAYATVRRAAQEVYATGTYGGLAGGLSHPELNALFPN